MSTITDDQSHDGATEPVTNRLHPLIYMLMIGFTAWFALAVWSFSGSGLVDYLLFIISTFIFVVMALTLVLSRVGEAGTPGWRGRAASLRDWAAGDYDTWTGRLSGGQAATQILLPLAAAAVGMTVIGLLFNFAA